MHSIENLFYLRSRRRRRRSRSRNRNRRFIRCVYEENQRLEFNKNKKINLNSHYVIPIEELIYVHQLVEK
jgi:hypothetical protein